LPGADLGERIANRLVGGHRLGDPGLRSELARLLGHGICRNAIREAMQNMAAARAFSQEG
jgi:hypothetical protein